MTERTSLDRRTGELGAAVYQLRQHLDVQRIIGLNVEGIRKAGLSEPLWAHFAYQAQISTAIALAAIYEKRSKDFVLSSIPAIILDLGTEGFPMDDKHAFRRFVETHGGKLKKTAKETVRTAYVAICAKHKAALDQLISIRNKRACHMEFGWTTDWMPSQDEQEKLWEFACDTYRLLHSEYNRVTPALMSKRVEADLIDAFKAMGITSPVRHRPAKRAGR